MHEQMNFILMVHTN